MKTMASYAFMFTAHPLTILTLIRGIAEAVDAHASATTRGGMKFPIKPFSTSRLMQIWRALLRAIVCMKLSNAAKVNSFGWCSAANSGLKAVTEQYLTPFPSLNTCSKTKWWNCDVFGKLSMLKSCADTLEIIGISMLKSQPYSSFGRTLPNTARAVHLRAERSQVPSRLHILHTRVWLSSVNVEDLRFRGGRPGPAIARTSPVPWLIKRFLIFLPRFLLTVEGAATFIVSWIVMVQRYQTSNQLTAFEGFFLHAKFAPSVW